HSPRANHGRHRRQAGLKDVEGLQATADSSAPLDSAGDLLFIGISSCVLCVFLVFNSLNVLHEHAESGHPLLFWEPIVWEGSSGAYFLSVAPAILMLTRRFWPLDRPRSPRLAVHVLMAVLVSLGHVVAIGLVRWAAYRLLGHRYNGFGPIAD